MSSCKRKSLAKHWKYSKEMHMTGLDQLPDDYKKGGEEKPKKLYKYPEKVAKLSKSWKTTKNSQRVVFNKKIPKLKARFSSGIGMKNYAELECIFLKEGYFHVNGVPFYHPWETIKKDMDTYEGNEFYLDHTDKAGTEVGLIKKVYEKVINGVKWAAATIRIPEVKFTQTLLSRMENGLINDVSSTHTAIYDVHDPNKKVTRILGQAISLVRKGEVEGARILSIKRNIRGEA